MVKRYVEEVIETLDKFMVSNGCEIIFNNSDQARAYRLKRNNESFWITYTYDGVWWVSYCDNYNIADRTINRSVEFDSTGKSKRRFLRYLRQDKRTSWLNK